MTYGILPPPPMFMRKRLDQRTGVKKQLMPVECDGVAMVLTLFPDSGRRARD